MAGKWYTPPRSLDNEQDCATRAHDADASVPRLVVLTPGSLESEDEDDGRNLERS